MRIAHPENEIWSASANRFGTDSLKIRLSTPRKGDFCGHVHKKFSGSIFYLRVAVIDADEAENVA